MGEEPRGLVRVCGREVEVGVECSGLHCEHEVSCGGGELVLWLEQCGWIAG